MNYLLFLFARIYFRIFPIHQKTRCIFRLGCEEYILKIFKEKGSLAGLKAAWFRFRNCRPGFSLFENPKTRELNMILCTDTILNEEEIAPHLLSLKKGNFKK